MNRFPRSAMLVVAAVIAAISLTGCTKVMDAGKVEKSVKSFLKGKSGDEKVTKVSCPDDVEAKTGKNFECKFSGSAGTSGTVNVEVTSTDGDATITLKTLKRTQKDVEEAISTDFKTTYPDSAAELKSVECPKDIPGKPGDSVKCTLTDTGGKTAELTVTVGDDYIPTWDFAEVTGG